MSIDFEKCNDAMTRTLQELKEESYDDSEAGDGEATNYSTAEDAAADYFYGIVDRLLDEYEMSEDEAIAFVTDIADAAFEEGDLPQLPASEEGEDVAYAEWLGAAETFGFSSVVLDAADEEAE